jgi:hypothetical protein
MSICPEAEAVLSFETSEQIYYPTGNKTPEDHCLSNTSRRSLKMYVNIAACKGEIFK